VSESVGHWVPCIFKGKRVYAEAATDGRLLERAGRVSIVYRLGADKSYRTFADRLRPMRGERVITGAPAPAPAAVGKGERKGPVPSPKKVAGEPRAGRPTRRDSSILGGGRGDVTNPDHIHIWTDGACSGNPGPAGAGTIVLFGDRRVDTATFLGPSTNNVAELTAILVGLRGIERDEERSLVVHTDSQYSIGVLAKGWKAKTNVALILRIQELMSRHEKLVWHWVRGHEGVALNEAADQLARAAVSREESFTIVTAEEE
jgi:ribonuclease HI